MNKNLEANRNRTLSKGIHKNIKVRAPKIDKTAISPYDRYCDGYGMPGAYGNGYVSVLKVSVGTVKKTDDILLDGIVSYDRAEINDAYVGQINMLTASSFCGVAGQVWGHDLAIHDSIANNEIKPLYELKQFDGTPLKVYDAKPLLDAGIELFWYRKK
ncbi:TPA: histidine decarboxylase, pyruvoyl type [Clostridium perfringens]